ncbi:AzlC family ABC transporter permease [Leifsonia sp. 71-9]|uniref:AzlC family ABC transporter permease n=1 Tax=Leifsonia sp. 71-9 TaxID=1895934 RepID=UPI00092A404B|nr:AzlC family ABC transporter permease [Leifsonia sp. 71-9]OJX80726.1 MAG: branched-chain amino acid ABC transporter permease [Leifsonia sp. 71-9]
MAGDRSPEVRAAARSGWAVGLATAAYGISFGALATASGLDVWQTCVLSLLMFSGGSQFALIGVLASGGTAAGGTAIASAALLGVRNSFYALRLSRIIDRGFWRRTAAVQLTIDESTAVATAQTDPRAQRVGFWITGLVVYIGWNLTTLAGALLGNLIGDVRAYGLDAAAAAAFLGLLWPRLKARQTQAVAVAAGFVATLLTPFIVPGLPVLAAAAVAIVVGVLNLFGRRDDPPHPEAIPMEREVEP